MINLLAIGQWQGFFKYGPEYGAIVSGQEAEFRLFVESINDGEFSGKIIDWDGFGANGEEASVKGFVDDDEIGFVKQYEQLFIIDEAGNSSVDENWPGHRVFYKGKYEPNTNQFVGTWEILAVLSPVTETDPEKIASGTWRLLSEGS